MKKRLLGIFAALVFASVISVGITASALGEYSESSAVLSKLGLIAEPSDLQLLGEETITKIDALNILVSIFGRGAENVSDDKAVFSDVLSGSSAFHTVSAAARLGIVKPSDGINFSPSEAITVHEFARMLVRASGYEYRVQKYNYSLPGYMFAALELDYLEKSDMPEDNYITKGQVYNAVYNMLLSATAVSYTSDGELKVYTDSDVSVLETYFDCRTAEGLYYGNEYTSLYGGNNFRKNNFAVQDIDGKNYIFEGSADDYKYFGYNVKVFYTVQNSKNTVLTVVKKNNREFVIEGQEFDGYDNSDRTFRYTKKEKIDSLNEKETSKKLRIPNSDIYLVYNGQYTTDNKTVFDIINSAGTENGLSVDKITFADNDSDGKYEVIFIDVYYDLFVDYVNPDDTRYVDTYGNAFEYNDDDYCVLLDDDGRETTFDKIAAGNVLRIKEGLGDPKLYSVRVTSSGKIARIDSKSYENGRTTVELVLGEQTNRGTKYQGSFVGGRDGDLPRETCKVAVSFEKHIDDLMTNAYSFYNLYFNADGELAGYKIFVFEKDTYVYATQMPFGGTTYNHTNIGVMLGAAKESGLKNDVKIKIFAKPHELRIYSVHDYDTTDDFKIKNIKESCLFIENPAEFYINAEDGSTDTVKVELYRRLESEYEKYGEDGSKYSVEVLRFIFGRKFVTYKLDENGEVYEIELPKYGAKDGELAYSAVPGQEWYKSSVAYFSLYDGSNITLPANTINFLIPDPDCSFADYYDLCQSTVESNAINNEYTYKMDFYTFNQDAANAQISVRFIDYDTLSSKATSGITGIVVNKTKGSSLYGYAVDNYYIVGGTTVNSDWGPRRIYGIYPETYGAPSAKSGNLGDRKYKYTGSSSGMSNLGYYYTEIDENTPVLDIEVGDVVTFYYPGSKSNGKPAERFNCARIVYDRSEDKLTSGVSASLTTLGDKKYVMGRIYDINEESVAFLPSYFEDDEDYEYGLKDCFIAYPNKVTVIKCEKKPDGGYTASFGEYADLYEGALKGSRVVAYIMSTANTPSVANCNFWIYTE